MRDGAEQAGHGPWYIELSQPTSSVLVNGQSYVSLITVSIFISNSCNKERTFIIFYKTLSSSYFAKPFSLSQPCLYRINGVK